jgi:NADH:ubiquinone oxidoreductase subunit B-like Fe-S oxidoreductase
MCTGPVTMQARDALLRTYEQMPDPKFVIAVGSCGLSGGVFHGCYNIVGGINELLPVDVFVPGCPPRPEGIIYGVAVLLEALKSGKRPEPIQWSGAGLDGVLHTGSNLEDHHV